MISLSEPGSMALIGQKTIAGINVENQTSTIVIYEE